MNVEEIIEFCRNVQEHYSSNNKNLERKHRIHEQLIEFCRQCKEPEIHESTEECPHSCEVYKAHKILWGVKR